MGRITDDTHIDLPAIPRADPLAPGQPVDQQTSPGHHGTHSTGPQHLPPNPYASGGRLADSFAPPGQPSPFPGDLDGPGATAPGQNRPGHPGAGQPGPFPGSGLGEGPGSFPGAGQPAPFPGTGAAANPFPGTATGANPFPGTTESHPFPGSTTGGNPSPGNATGGHPFPGSTTGGNPFPGSATGGHPFPDAGQPGSFPGSGPLSAPAPYSGTGPLAAPHTQSAEPLPQRKPRDRRPSADEGPGEGFDYFGGGAPAEARGQQPGSPAGQRIPHTPGPQPGAPAGPRIPHAAAPPGAAPSGGPNAPEAPADWSPWQRRRSPYDPPSAPLPTQPPGFENFQTDSFAAVGAQHTGGFPESPSMPLPAWAANPPMSAPPAQGSEEEARPAKKPRSHHLDNVKFVLIALVISSHALRDTINADPANKAGYIWAFAFHMPLFVMISGYLSRNFWDSKGKVNKLVDTILIPYVVVELGYAALRWGLGGKWSLTITDPAWMNWYLVALLLWRITVPVWRRLRWPFPVAVAVYLISGFSQLEQDFSMDRFFGLLPFFVLGMILQPHHFEWLQKSWVRMISAFVLAAWTAAAVVLAPDLGLKVFYNRYSYADLNQEWLYALGFRLAWMTGVLALCFAILSIIPKRETWFSDLGTRTLYAYLLHGIPILILKDFGLLKLSWLEGPLGTLAIIVSSFVLAIILCLPVTRAVFRWVLEPRLTWLYRKPQSEVQP
ncbi:acyltransferase family protein [Herbidospora cretacea]|uniref:acyltransferase family protein n=1 Tax=Herbidospora cretacea TaxID=28444 RepID=UPI00077449CA|nr:acyltransferase family protein [Herbidospora cretacea]